MASIPQLYSFSNDFHRFQNPLLFPQENCLDGLGGLGEEISFPVFLDNIGLDVFQQEPILTSSVPTAHNNVRYQPQDVCDEFGHDCNGFVHQGFKPVDPTVGENWGIQANLMQPVNGDNNHKAVRYSAEERKDRILRYLKKRNQRNFNKTIKYACRKSLADRRVRVRGRFARNNTEQCEEEMVIRKEDDYSPIHKNFNYSDAVQMKHDEDDWLQEAMANLIYLPYMAG